MGGDVCVCPFCGADIPNENIYTEEFTSVAEAECPECGRSYTFLAGED